jgi:hypothetical protein
MSEFDYIVEETKLDGEIEAIKFVLSQILNDYELGGYNTPNDVQKITWLLNGYLQELKMLKDNP